MGDAAGRFSYIIDRPCAADGGRQQSIDRYRRVVARLNELMRELPSAPLYTDDLAGRIGISPRTLQTAVHVVFGLSLHGYIRSMRLRFAHHQLKSGCRSVKDAALGNGFSHMSDFARLYQEVYGEKPCETIRARKLRDELAHSKGK